MQETQETWVQSLGWEDPLVKEMTTHSSIPAWKTHGQRILAGYISWGRKRVGRKRASKQQQQITIDTDINSRICLYIPHVYYYYI